MQDHNGPDKTKGQEMFKQSHGYGYN